MTLSKEQITKKIQENMVKDVNIKSKYNLEKFNYKRYDRSGKAYATMDAKGILRFNTVATRDLIPGNSDQYPSPINGCNLYYDKSKNVIVIELTKSPEAMKVSYSKNQALLHIRNYLEHFNIPVQKTTSYDTYLDEDYIIVDLNKVIEGVGRWGRHKNAQA
jgi:hypothetical protein